MAAVAAGAAVMEGPCGRLLNAAEALAIDEELMSTPGFSTDQLMELAGLSCACAVAAAFPLEQYPTGRVLVVCGPGNNGGDGLVAARHLFHFGYTPVVVYPKRTAKQLYVNLVTQLEWLSVPIESALPASISDFVCVLDGIFGFSFKSGSVRAPFDAILEQLSAAGAPPIVSIDIPSGWDVETGPPAEGPKLSPSVLISLTAPKLCAAHFGGRHFLGGRFVPPGILAKYGLKLPPYPGASQVLELPNAKM